MQEMAGIVTGSIVGGHAKELTTPDDTTQQDQISYLREICRLLTEIHEQMNSPAKDDIKEIIQLSKQGFGANWIPIRRTSTYIEVYAPVATAVLCSTPLGAPFVITIPAPTSPNLWLPWDFPDGSSFILDTSATANQMYIYTRWTNSSAR